MKKTYNVSTPFGGFLYVGSYDCAVDCAFRMFPMIRLESAIKVKVYKPENKKVVELETVETVEVITAGTVYPRTRVEQIMDTRKLHRFVSKINGGFYVKLKKGNHTIQLNRNTGIIKIDGIGFGKYNIHGNTINFLVKDNGFIASQKINFNDVQIIK